MAGGNFIFGIIAYGQEFEKMDCIRQAIYQHATENGFLDCLINKGIFDVGSLTWVSVQFVLIVASILVAYTIEKK